MNSPVNPSDEAPSKTTYTFDLTTRELEDCLGKKVEFRHQANRHGKASWCSDYVDSLFYSIQAACGIPAHIYFAKKPREQRETRIHDPQAIEVDAAIVGGTQACEARPLLVKIAGSLPVLPAYPRGLKGFSRWHKLAPAARGIWGCGD